METKCEVYHVFDDKKKKADDIYISRIVVHNGLRFKIAIHNQSHTSTNKADLYLFSCTNGWQYIENQLTLGLEDFYYETISFIIKSDNKYDIEQKAKAFFDKVCEYIIKIF